MEVNRLSRRAYFFTSRCSTRSSRASSLSIRFCKLLICVSILFGYGGPSGGRIRRGSNDIESRTGKALPHADGRFECAVGLAGIDGQLKIASGLP